MSVFDRLLESLRHKPLTELEDLAKSSDFELPEFELDEAERELTEDEMIDFIADLPTKERNFFINELRREEEAYLKGDVIEE
ncbi:MAG: hypothetical protein HQL54_09730 [Magnetococcales bacterium]|nr:hypothetical protein [Magnetococcales bacterium]